MTSYSFVRLGAGGPTYEDLLSAWRAECENYGEDFDTYTAIPIGIFNEIMEKDKANTGLFVARADDGSFGAVCMVNHASIPNYDSPVLRVRHILLSPKFDFTDMDITEYATVLIAILNGVISCSETDDKLKANHIKFHARSPADMQFFAAFGKALGGADLFASVHVSGAWLYVTKK